MARTDKKVWYTPKSKLPAAPVGPASDSGSSAADVEKAIKTIEGRWKMVILSHLFARPVMRFSELERAIPGVSQKMLVQQLREPDRRPHDPQVPPKVEYQLTELGRALCPALKLLLDWATVRKQWRGAAAKDDGGKARWR